MTNYPPSEFSSHFEVLKRQAQQRKAESRIRESFHQEAILKGVLAEREAIANAKAASQEFAVRARRARIPARKLKIYVGRGRGKSFLGIRGSYADTLGWMIEEPYLGSIAQNSEEGDVSPSPGIAVLADGRCAFGVPLRILPGTETTHAFSDLAQRRIQYSQELRDIPKLLAAELFRLNPNA